MLYKVERGMYQGEVGTLLEYISTPSGYKVLLQFPDSQQFFEWNEVHPVNAEGVPLYPASIAAERKHKIFRHHNE